ncbi:MAG: DUF1015 domain-containing protein, partial [Planctomycetota bacterium]|nr:DUF1015 domain-containing protein [Planctomycetota bacterium]
MEIAPFRGLRYALQEIGETAENVTAPPYDVISPEEHRRLLDRSPYNLTRLTLGVEPGSASSYDERGERLREWVSAGALRAEEEPALYVNAVDYASPASGRRSRLLGLVALGRLSPFEERIVLAHERTFPRVVDDRERLLRATRANLESILLLYSDPEGTVDRLLEEAARAEPLIRVEAKPGEHHALHAIRDPRGVARLVELFRAQRPIIADGHHRYTTSLRFAEAHGEARSGGSSLPGADWRLMT